MSGDGEGVFFKYTQHNLMELKMRQKPPLHTTYKALCFSSKALKAVKLLH